MADAIIPEAMLRKGREPDQEFPLEKYIYKISKDRGK